MTEQVVSPRRRATRLVILLMLVLVGASLLAPDTVDTWADTRDAGWGRTVARAWADPVGDFSRRLLMDVPLRRVERLVDGERGGAVPGGLARPGPDAPSTTRAPRTADADRPLRILAVGDSLMLDLQYGMERDLDRRPDVVVEGRGALGFGFTVPYWDWGDDVLTDYDRLVAEVAPDVVVVMIGANEFEGHAIDGEDLTPGSPRWREVLADRAGEAIAHWRVGGAHVYWWATPRMRDARFLTDDLNAVWVGAAEAWGAGVTMIDSMAVLGDADGAYREVLSDGSGAEVALRKDHGVHFHEVGADLLARQLEARLVADGWLDPVP